MTYTYRRDEGGPATPYAPYVMREEQHHVVELPLDTTKCGTFRGYKQHLYRGQQACDRCKKAAAQNSAEHRARKKGGG